MFTKAIVRLPAPNFSEGLTTVSAESGLGRPQFKRALEQHAAYCAALEQCGLTLTTLEPDPNYPDSTFVEDTAILTERLNESSSMRAVITRPGAPSRRGEVIQVRAVLAEFYRELLSIDEPGTLDGGDVCQAGHHFFIGLSERTNEAGAQQLAELLASFDYTSTLVDIRKIDGLLHLKSGLAYLGDGRFVVTEALDAMLHATTSDAQTNSLPYALPNRPTPARLPRRGPRGRATAPKVVRVNAEQAYAANCIRVNDYVLLAAGYPSFEETLRELGFQTIALEMSEFQKMDGGLSCLSLRL
jgi:dimethylargininase